MKSVIYLLLGAVTLFSCRAGKLGKTNTAPAPYVQLKNGKTIHDSVERKERFLKSDQIIVGGTTMKAKDVAFFSTGTQHFANVGRESFAPQVSSGKINLYKYTYTTEKMVSNFGSPGSHTEREKHIRYYVQKDLGTPIHFLNYKYLKPMIEPNTPEFKMLERYRKTRIVTRSLGYGSLGLLASGVVLANGNNDAAASVGATLAGVGVAAFFGWVGTYFPNRMRLLKTVTIANMPPRQS